MRTIMRLWFVVMTVVMARFCYFDVVAGNTGDAILNGFLALLCASCFVASRSRPWDA